MRFINPEKTIIQDGNRSIPVDPDNMDHRRILESGVTIDSYVALRADDAPTLEERVAALRKAVLTGDKTDLQAIDAMR